MCNAVPASNAQSNEYHPSPLFMGQGRAAMHEYQVIGRTAVGGGALPKRGSDLAYECFVPSPAYSPPVPHPNPNTTTTTTKVNVR